MNMKKFVTLFLPVLFSLVLMSCGGKKNLHETGLIFDKEKYDSIPKKAVLATRAYENLPERVDLRPYAPYSGDQTSYRMCTAWATTYGAMTTCESIVLGRTDRELSSQNVFSPFYLFRKCKPNDRSGRADGLSIEDALETLKAHGVPKQIAVDSQVDFSGFDLSMYNGQRLFKIADYATLFSSDADDAEKILAVKKSLSEKKPVVIGFYYYPESFYRAGEIWNPSRWDRIGDGGHAMVIVAYDDTLQGGSFLFMNSWGRDWGSDGCTWVRYSDFARYTRGAYEMNSVLGVLTKELKILHPLFLSEKEEPAPVEKSVVYKGEISLPLAFENAGIAVKYEKGVYRSERSFESGDRFRICMTNTRPCYVYVFGSDETSGKTSRLFPPEGTSALLDYSENPIVLPSETEWIKLDDVQGRDYLVILYSLKELNLDEIMTSYEKSVYTLGGGAGLLYSRVKESLGQENLISLEKSEFAISEINFSAWVNGDGSGDVGVLPILISIEHGN